MATLSIFHSHKNTYEYLRKLFSRISDKRANNKSISLTDAMTSLFAVFTLKFASLLKFEETRNDDEFKSNLHSLFGVKKIPSDTQMRTIIDKIPHKTFFPFFKSLFSIIQRGKLLNEFEYTKKKGRPWYLVAVDGTEYHSSKKVSCKKCMIKNHRDKTQTYYHQALSAVIVHPDKKQVIPLAVEEIKKQDGKEKNDCEYSAFKRLAARLKKDHPKLNMIICGDALYAKGDLVKLLRRYEMSYILNVKPKGNSKLWGYVEEQEWDQGFCKFSCCIRTIGNKVLKKVHYFFRYANNVRLDNSPSSGEFNVNFLQCKEINKWIQKKKKKEIEKVERKNFSWVTDLSIKDLPLGEKNARL